MVLPEVWFLTKEEDDDGEEEAYGRRDRHEAASGRCADGTGTAGRKYDPVDRRDGSGYPSLTETVLHLRRWRAPCRPAYSTPRRTSRPPASTVLPRAGSGIGPISQDARQPFGLAGEFGCGGQI